MIVYRHCSKNRPFVWESADQPSARWHAHGEGPVHYFADTPDGAWAEFLRHAEVDDLSELDHIQRDIWAIEIDNEPPYRPNLPYATLVGDKSTYAACQAAARQLRANGIRKIQVPSAALRPGGASGWVNNVGLQPGPTRDGLAIVIFDNPIDAVGWLIGTCTVPSHVGRLYVRL